MGRKKSKSSNDWRRYKKFEEENQKLRKEVSKLRKVINSMVVDKLEEKISHVKSEKEPESKVCEVCGNDEIHTVPIQRADGEFEIRICISCRHRSQLKKSSKK